MVNAILAALPPFGRGGGGFPFDSSGVSFESEMVVPFSFFAKIMQDVSMSASSSILIFILNETSYKTFVLCYV